MRLIPLGINLSLGVFGFYLEFRNIKESDIFFTDFVVQIPLLLLCSLTIFYLFEDKKYYVQSKKITAYLPSFVGFCFIALIISHIYVRYRSDESKTWFTASNLSINSEGIILDFKENNHLKSIQVQKFGETYYWGSYEKVGDKLRLHLETDFPLSTNAYIVKDSLGRKADQLHFENDQTIFQVWYEPDTTTFTVE